jgi:hypothetical protein
MVVLWACVFMNLCSAADDEQKEKGHEEGRPSLRFIPGDNA